MDKKDIGIILQIDYLLDGKAQKLNYRKTSAGVFIYGSSSVVSMTNQIEKVIKFLISKKIIDENHTLKGKCLYYRDSDKQWNPVWFGHGRNGFYFEWPDSSKGYELLSDEEMADFIEKTIAKPFSKYTASKYPFIKNSITEIVNW